MKRRTLLTSVASVSMIGGVGVLYSQTRDNESTYTHSVSDPQTEMEPVTDEDLPQSVVDTRPLMESFTKEVLQYYPDGTVSINRDAEMFFEYVSDRDSPEGVQSEIHQIADRYIDAADGHEAVTLTIVTSGVKAIIPEDTAQKRLDGELENDAFHETIGLMARE